MSREIHDFHRTPAFTQMLANREESERIHLINRGHIDAIRVAEISEKHVISLTKIKHARRVQKDQSLP